jgi:aspartate kinase
MGGFIASNEAGITTTLGRGGSDFTGALIGGALQAEAIEIWTDVDGIMTTDPKLCSHARVIRKMSFDEAAELAHLGAKVLHPATLAPAMRENISVYVLNSRRPEGEGTEILARAKTGNPVSAITAKRNVAAVEIESAGRVDSEFLRAVSAVFDRHSCSVDLMALSLGRDVVARGFDGGFAPDCGGSSRCRRGAMGESQGAGLPGRREHSTTARRGKPRLRCRFGYGGARCLPGRL